MRNYEKFRKQQLKKFHKSLRITKKYTNGEIDSTVIAHAKSMGKDLEYLWLTVSQMRDKEFLLKLYESNVKATRTNPPAFEELKSDNDFMFEYIKLAYRYHQLDSVQAVAPLSIVVRPYKELLLDPVFLERLGREFPVQNILTEFRDSFGVMRMVSKDTKSKIETTINMLGEEYLIVGTKRHGAKFVQELPVNHPLRLKLIELAIENDGFTALNLLNIDEVYDNRKLIYKAYEKDGVQALWKYLTKTLSPNVERYYMCHGDPHYDCYFSKKNAEVQRKLFYDEKIWTILESERQKQEKEKQKNNNTEQCEENV